MVSLSRILADWQIFGRFVQAVDYSALIKTVSADYTLGADDHVLLVSAVSGDITITLPDASTVDGRQYHIKKVDSSVNSVTLDGYSGQTIDGDITQIITAQYDSVLIVSDGSNWYIL